MAAEYEASVEQLHRAFGDRTYWLERLADSGADQATLDSMTVSDDGGIDVVTTQVLRRDRLPGIVTQFHPGDLAIVREEAWSPVKDGKATATVTGAIPGAPVTLSGNAVLAPSRQRRLAAGVHRGRRGADPARGRQGRELHRRPTRRVADRRTAIHYGVDQGERLTGR